METPDDLIVGQHVICPYCQIKFALEANQKVEVDASGSEILTDDDTVNENIMLSLRTVNGLDLQKHAERFGPAELTRLEKEAGPLLEAGFLKLSDGNLIIPEEQWFVSDGTISSLFV